MSDMIPIGSLSARTTELGDHWEPDCAYDRILVAASWESRATAAASKMAGLALPVTILRFESSDPAIDVLKDAQIAEYQQKLNVSEQITLQKSLNAKENCAKIKAWIEDEYRRLGRPLKILIDITCLPKSYVMFLIGMGFYLDIVSRLDLLYSPGQYDLYGSNESEAFGSPRSLISVGDWVSHQIPYLNSATYMRGKRSVYVALGGEIALTLPFIERLEPDRLRVAFIADTAPETPDQYINSERAAYEELIQAPNYSNAVFSLKQGVEMAADLLAFARESGCEGVTALAVGCKTHAAGMALASLAEAKIEVVTRIPAAYKLSDVRPTGSTYLIEIIDRFDPHAYLP